MVRRKAEPPRAVFDDMDKIKRAARAHAADPGFEDEMRQDVGKTDCGSDPEKNADLTPLFSKDHLGEKNDQQAKPRPLG